MPKLLLLVQEITGQIQSLYDLSSLLRHPKSPTNVFALSALMQAAMHPLIRTPFRSDSACAFRTRTTWRGLNKAERTVPFDEEEPTPTGASPSRDDVKDIVWFCERLARANTRRREQL